MEYVKPLVCINNLIGLLSILTATPFIISGEQMIDSYMNVTCPTDKPFIMKNGTKSICVSSCGPNLVADGNNCIRVEDCNKPVLSDRKCMEMCEEGYLYVAFDFNLLDGCGDEMNTCTYSSDNIGQKLCKKKIYLILQLAGYVTGIVLYIVFLSMFFSTRRFSCNNFITWCKVKNPMKRTASTDLLLCNDDVLDGEDGQH